MRSRRNNKNQRHPGKGTATARRRIGFALVQVQRGARRVQDEVSAGEVSARRPGRNVVGPKTAGDPQVSDEAGRRARAAVVFQTIVVAGNQTGGETPDDRNAEVFGALGPGAAAQARPATAVAQAQIVVDVVDHGRVSQRARSQVFGFQHRRRHRFSQREHGHFR